MRELRDSEAYACSNSDLGEETKKSEETAFVTPIFFGFRMIGRTDFIYCENFKRFHRSKLKKIKIKAKLPLVNASLCGVLAQERKSLY